MKDYKNMNNSEIKIEMKNLENKFEKTKLDIIALNYLVHDLEAD